MNDTTNLNKIHNRYAWADVLKIVSAFAVVWIHTTANVYDDFHNKSWIWYLLVSSFQTFGVPCFYMVSGALLLSSNTSIKTSLQKRVPRILIPLIFWSIVYILLRKFILGENLDILTSVIKLFFESQYYHLWFMYPLLGLYFLLPIIALLFKEKENHNLLLYCLMIFLFVPATFYSILSITGFWTDRPWFALGFPELGLFILGKVLFDRRGQLQKYKKFLPILILFGYLLTVISSYYLSTHFLSPRKDFFETQRIPVIIYCSSIFALFVCSFSNINTKLKLIFSELGNLSFGIYLIHPLLMALIKDIHLTGPIAFTINKGGNFNMFLGAVFYFVLSGVIIFFISKIPLVKKLI